MSTIGSWGARLIIRVTVQGPLHFPPFRPRPRIARGSQPHAQHWLLPLRLLRPPERCLLQQRLKENAQIERVPLAFVECSKSVLTTVPWYHSPSCALHSGIDKNEKMMNLGCTAHPEHGHARRPNRNNAANSTPESWAEPFQTQQVQLLCDICLPSHKCQANNAGKRSVQ